MILYDNAFSPFARKVRLIIEYKGLNTKYIDPVEEEKTTLLSDVNPRCEVPVLIDNDITIINSADIASYLDYNYLNKPIYPKAADLRVKARKWERISDTKIDPIMVNISYWKWSNRSDKIPEKMLDTARLQLAKIYQELENELCSSEFICNEISIAEFALFPHLIGAAFLEVPIDKDTYPNLTNWINRLKAIDIFQGDMKRAKFFLQNISKSKVEKNKIFWRGDRIEWILANGFEDWFYQEIKSDKVLWPPQ